jgi:CDGSH-type Zn-finger protein
MSDTRRSGSPPDEIRPYRDGPIVVRRAGEAPRALCRCGRSERKPRCDASHRAAGFRADGFEGPDCDRRTS